jgi:hypothetical protein
MKMRRMKSPEMKLFGHSRLTKTGKGARLGQSFGRLGQSVLPRRRAAPAQNLRAPIGGRRFDAGISASRFSQLQHRI